MQYPSPYAKVFSLWCAGLASGTNNDFETALGCYSQALQLISDTRVAVEFETEIQAALAETHYSAGHFEPALDLAQKTLVLSQQRSNRLTECRARIILGGGFQVAGARKNSTGCSGLIPASRAAHHLDKRDCVPAEPADRAYASGHLGAHQQGVFTHAITFNERDLSVQILFAIALPKRCGCAIKLWSGIHRIGQRG